MDRAIHVDRPGNTFSVDPGLVMDVPVLQQQYRGDPIRAVVTDFANRGVSMEELKEWQVKYPIIYPWDAAYYIEKIGYNRIIQVYPLAIIMTKTLEEIVWALNLATRLSIPFSIKSGGHDHVGASLSNGIIINVSRRNKAVIANENGSIIDRSSKTNRSSTSIHSVTVGSGTLLGYLITELTKIKGVLPIGTCSNTSIMFAAGAGIGLFVRMYGLTLDSLRSAIILLADNTVIEANGKKNADLFWALRGGGGGNFGIVIDMKFEFYKLEYVILYELKFDTKDFRSLLKAWQNFAPYAPKELASKLSIIPGGDILMKGQFIGTSSDLKDLLSDFIPSSKSQRIWRSSVYESALYNNDTSENPPWFFFYQTLFSDLLGTKALDILQSFAAGNCSIADSRDVMSHNCSIIINALGGKFAEVDKSDTAFFWRESKMWIHLSGETKDYLEFDTIKLLIQKLYKDLLGAGLALRGKSYGRMYVNFKDVLLSPEQYMDAYYGDNKEKLLQVKKKYDPNNLFSGLHTIPVIGNEAKVLPFGF